MEILVHMNILRNFSSYENLSLYQHLAKLHPMQENQEIHGFMK